MMSTFPFNLPSWRSDERAAKRIAWVPSENRIDWRSRELFHWPKLLGLWNSYCIPIPEKRSGKGSSQSVPYVRLYCSRGLVCFLKEKFNRRTLYKFSFRSWLQAPKLFEYLAKEVDRKKGIPEKPSQGHTAYGPCKGKRHRGGTEKGLNEWFPRMVLSKSLTPC